MTGPRKFEHYGSDERWLRLTIDAGRIRIERAAGDLALTLSFDELRWLVESAITSALYALEAEATG